MTLQITPPRLTDPLPQGRSGCGQRNLRLAVAGGIGDGPGETRPFSDTHAVLTRLPGDILQLQNGRARLRFSSSGDLLEHRMFDYGRFLRLGENFLQYYPFDSYFLHDAIVFCANSWWSPTASDGPNRMRTIMRTDWSLDRLDTLGIFLAALEAPLKWGRESYPISSPLGPVGILRVGGHDRPRLLYARNDRYRIEVWDISTGALSMVVGTVQLPHDLEVKEIGEDYVLGIATDDMGIQYVRVYGLSRAPFR